MSDQVISIPEARRQLHEIVRKDVPFDEKTREALELATRCLELDYGLLVQVDQVTDHWEAVITTETGDGQPSPEKQQELQKTYCRETLAGDTPLALHDAPDQGWADDPAFETSNFHTYLGVPVILGEESYGTVCFLAEDSRSDTFTDAETWFVEHLARLLERELEREQVEAQLTSQTNLATVLNRVLRHNLRNDISVVRGYIASVAEQVNDDAIVETILDQIDELIDLSEKARDLETILTASTERKHTEIGALIEVLVAELAQEYTNASISIEYEEDVHVAVLQNFDRALEELIENALEHSGESPTVTVSIEPAPNSVDIRIRDDGPGLPDQEVEALIEGEETPLTHGTGLGLWLAHWIVSSHDGSIDPVVTENGTTIVVSIPRKPAVGVQQQLTELTRSRNKYKAAFNAATDAIALLDNEGQIIEANPKTAEVFGLDTEEVLGRSVTEFLPREFEFDTERRDFLETRVDKDTVTITGADGEERILEYSTRADIIPGQHLFISRDITERKERERRYNAIFNQTYQFTGLLDPDGTIREVNETALEFVDLNRKDVVGKPLWETAWWEGADTTQREIRNAIDRAATGEFVREEVEIHGDEGTAVIDFSIRPITNDQGNITMLIPEGRNITARKERERELKAVKERYETLLGAAPDPVFVADVETEEVIEVNEAAETLLGKSSGEIAGLHFSKFHPSDQSEQYRQLFEELVETGGTAQQLPDGTQTFIETDGGKQIPVEISVKSVSLPEREVIFGIFRDISERVEREQQLEEANQRLETVLDTAKAAIFMKDLEGRYQLLNDHCAELLGLDDPAEGIGQTDVDLFPETVAAEYRADDEAIMESGESRVIEEEVPTEDGPRMYRTHKSPIRDADGGIQGVCAVSTDITWRTELERDLEEETVFNDNVLNSLSDIFYVFDLNGTLVEYNDRLPDVTGYDDDEVAEMPLKKFFKEDEQARIAKAATRVTEREEHVEIEGELVTKEGKPIPYEFSAAPYYDSDGKVAGLVGTGREITERVAYERELEALTERYETLLGAAPDPVFVADTETGEIIETNEAAETLLGASNDEIVGLHQSDLHPADQSEQYRHLFEEHIETGETKRQLPNGSQIYVETLDGEQIPVEISVSSVSLPDRSVIFGIFRNISRRRASQ